MSLGGCKDKDQSGDWAGHGSPAPEPSAEVATATPEVEGVKSTEALVTRDAGSEVADVRFVAYNVENWLTMDRYVDGQSRKGAPKPEKERQAITEVLVKARPDILGVSEIGTEDDVRDLQGYLERAGHPMPHFHLNRGSDPTRSLVLLSRFPIGKTLVHDDLSYRSNGREYQMQRGILDATVTTPVGDFRFLGVHLKSKREVDDGDQADMRLHEAHLLRREIDGIIKESPDARLVVYGDFNDTRQSPAIRAVRGSGRNDRSLAMVAIKDSRGEYWTHHWSYEDIYSRIDFVMISNPLKGSIDWDRCRILDDEAVTSASDHRPLLVILR
ncbi:endonuclease/exonuclease/phosphatase family protein [Luteolibacter marinus]|uniref:endonuclease/exonuclease/phosphatase family protein n=1 Tax=Luteolibacter marinus TaxID=2776705 RepID=UPI001D0088A1|nr:endonuclease/exonuclease/phosphatase family protein [Luteolibacter marinus]